MSNHTSDDRPDPTEEPRAEGARRDRPRADRSHERRRSHRHGRKERVLHTRISEQLSEDIRRLAEDLRVPASNLVRNILEEVFTVVETVSDDVGELFEDVLEEASATRDRIRRHGRRRRHGHHRHRSRRSWADVAEEELRQDEASEAAPPRAEPAPRPERPAFPEVIGWQPLVLNQTQSCADCGCRLPRGARAFVGMTETGLSRDTLCRDCIQER